MTSSIDNTGPGDVLRDTRQAKHISVEEVAERLKLRSEVVEAIEANDLEALPAPAFVRGYLRSYALLMELDPDKLIDQYHTIAPSDPELSDIYPPRHPKQSIDPMILWVTAGISVLLLVFFILWAGDWYKSYIQKSQTESGQVSERITSPYYSGTQTHDGEPTQSAASGMSVDASAEQEGLDEGLPAQNDINETAVEGSDSGKESEQVQTPLLSTSSLPTLEDEVSTVTAESVVDTPLEQIAETDLVQEEAESNVKVTPVAPEGRDELHVLAAGESWVDITDANGHRLMYRMIESSEAINLKGQAPFDIVLGASPNVSISINGQDYDHSAFTRANLSARFILRAQN